MKLINTFSFGEFVGGIAGLIAVIGVLVVAAKVMSTADKGVKVKMSGFFSLALAITVLVGVMKLITSVFRDAGEFLLGLAGMIGVMLALAGFSKLISGVDISIKSAGSLLILSVVVGILAGIMVAIGQVSWDTLGKGVIGLIGVMGSLALFAFALSKLSSGIKIGPSLVLILGFAGVIAAFAAVMNAIKDVDPSVMLSFAASLGVSLAALMAALKIAGGMGVGMMAKGAAGIGVAVSIIVGIGTVLVAALGAINQLTNGGLVSWLESGGEVLEAFGKAIGALVGGFVSGFIGPVGEALTSLSNGLEGIGDNDNLDEDIEKAIHAVESIGGFVTTLSSMNIERNPGFLFRFYFGENKTNSLLSQIEEFGNSLSSVAGALHDLEGLDETDVQFAIDAANSVSEFITSIKDMPGIEVEPGLFKKFFGDETKTSSLLSQIREFSISMTEASIMLFGFKSKELGQSDIDNVIAIATSITEFIAGVRDNAPEEGYADDLFNAYYGDLMSQISGFGKAMEDVKSGIAGLNEGEQKLTDEDIEKAKSTVKAIGEWILALDENLSGLENIETSSSWLEKTFVGESATESIFSQISTFAESMGKAKENLSGMSKLSDADITQAVSAAESISDFILSLGKSEKLQTMMNTTNTEGQSIFTGIDSVFTDIVDFSDTINQARTNLTGLGSEDITTDVTKAVDVANQIVDFFAVYLQEQIPNMDSARGVLDTWLNGESGTDAFLTRVESFVDSMGEIINTFTGISETSLTDDVTTATDTIDDLVEMLANMGSTENSEAINRLIGISGEALPDAVNRYLTGLGSAIDYFDQTVEGVNFDNVGKISEFLSSMNGLVAESEGFTGIMTAFETLQSTMSGEGENAIDTSTWLSGLNSEDVIARLTDFTTAVNGALTMNTESLSAQVDAFTSAGGELASALSSGIGSNSDTSGVKTLCNALVSAAKGYYQNFFDVGRNLGWGVARGITDRTGIVESAARRIISRALSAMRAAADVHSPSKETEKIARFMDMGLANGLNGYSKVVSRAAEGVAGEALDSTKNTLANLSTVLSEDMDTTPVIRPVMDMSNISAGARTINGIFSGGRTLSVGVTAEKAQAASAAMRESRKRQNGSNDAASLISNANDSSVNLTGNNFYIRSDQDVRALASEIAALTKQQQRSYGAAY